MAAPSVLTTAAGAQELQRGALTVLAMASRTTDDALPRWSRTAARSLARVPAPLGVAFTVAASAALSTGLASALQRRAPRLVPRMQRLPFVRYMLPSARDGPFLVMYAACQLLVLLVLGVATLVTQQAAPTTALLGAALSVVGVGTSVWLDAALSVASDDSATRATSSAPGPSVRRRTFLHTVMGATLACTWLLLPTWNGAAVAAPLI